MNIKKEMTQMKKLKKWVDILMDGGNIHGFKNVPLATRWELLRVYTELNEVGKSCFIDEIVREILAKAKINTKIKGIGWEARL